MTEEEVALAVKDIIQTVAPDEDVTDLDPECAMRNLVANSPLQVGRVDTILNMSFGMLGINSAVVVGRPS